MSSWASQAHAFHQPVCQRLSWLHHWSVPHVYTIRVFSSSEWGPDPQCQAAQVAHWTWWWQCLAAWHCRSVWSLPSHFAADAGGWLCQWPSLAGIEHCAPHTRAVHMAMCFEREVAWSENCSSSLNFFQAVFTCVVVESSQPPAAESIIK